MEQTDRTDCRTAGPKREAPEEKASWESGVRRVVPYTPGEQPRRAGIIKLNTNECPYPPSPRVKRLAAEFETDVLRLYPDPEASLLVKSIARRFQVKEEQVFVGVGSDDVLAMAFLTFFNTGRPILFPDVTYSFYDVWANLFGIPFRRPALDGNFRLKKEDYLTENGGIVIANPNAPTGICEPLSVIEEIVSGNPGSLVIIDEAYVDFGGESALPLVEKYENLLVVQTFSKSRAMAGMRIGFAIGSPKAVRCLRDVKFSFNSYTMDAPSIAWGAASMEDEAYFQETVEKIKATREYLKGQLAALGFSFPDSRANFLFASHESIPAQELFGALKAAGIYVRYFPGERTGNFLRITVGTEEQTEALLSFLRGYLKQ